MSDSNPTRVRYAKNKAAFDEVIGDPFAKPEPIDGAYIRLKRRSTLRLSSLDDVGRCLTNPAKPNAMDFFCDVEHVISSIIRNPYLQERFWKTYLCDESLLGQVERSRLEQRIGSKFRARRISPVNRYFTALRRKTNRQSA